MGSWLEAAIIAVIFLGIAVAIFKGGAANPVSTGGLKTKLAALDSDLKAVKTEVSTVKTRVAELDQRAATKGDIKRIEASIAEWDHKLERLDLRLDGLDCELARIGAVTDANQTVVTAMAESLRVTTAMVQEIDAKLEATSTITSRVPAFIDRVLTELATTAEQTRNNSIQVERLYNFLTEKALK
jgi:chromosome segregation ATPase